MLDVAAVAERLFSAEPFGVGLQDALVVLAGLNDLGRVSDSSRVLLQTG